MKHTSNLFRALSRPELDTLAAACFNANILRSELLEGGMFNTTYLITLADGEKIVLRAGPVNRHLLIPFEENLMNAERHVYERCRAVGVPVPEVLACDTTKQLIDRDYMITAYINSTVLAKLGADASAKQKIYHDVGRYAKQMHSVENDRFGRVSDVLRGGGYAKWSDCLQAEISCFTEKAAQTRLYSAKRLRRIEQIMPQYAQLLDEIEAPKLTHADLWDGNILVSGGDTVAAVIDADRAIYGDPEFEFAAGWITSDAFFQGYGQRPPQDDAQAIRQKIYQLLYRLLDSYIFLVQYNNRPKSRANQMAALRLTKNL